MAGLWAEAHDPATGEVADTYTVIITDANAAMRVHDRMPAILATDAARRWIESGPTRPRRPSRQLRGGTARLDGAHGSRRYRTYRIFASRQQEHLVDVIFGNASLGARQLDGPPSRYALALGHGAPGSGAAACAPCGEVRVELREGHGVDMAPPLQALVAELGEAAAVHKPASIGAEAEIGAARRRAWVRAGRWISLPRECYLVGDMPETHRSAYPEH